MPRHFSNWLDAYVDYASYSEPPLMFHRWTGLSVLAGALRRRVWIDQRFFQWTPNLYIIFVGPPGIIAKSTTISIGHNLLKQVNGINFGPQSLTWQSLLHSLAENVDLIELEPGRYAPMCAITCAVTELGTFFDPSERDMLDTLTALWDGQLGSFDRWTKTQGNDIVQNPWVNIIACTTPRWLRDNVSENIMGGGLASRIVWLYGNEKRHLVAYPADSVPPDHRATAQQLIEDLEHIATQLMGEYRLEPEAKAWGREWYAQHYAFHTTQGYDDSMSGYVARKQSHMHKIAMILAASQRDELVVTLSELQEAESLLDSAESQMAEVFNCLKATAGTELLERIIQYVRRNGAANQKEVFNAFRRTHDLSAILEALKGAILSGQIRGAQEGDTFVYRAG